MVELIIRTDNSEELNLLENLLKKMQVSFERKTSFSTEMISAVEQAKAQDKSEYTDAFKVLDNMSKKYGI